jgi:hypothetical protein
MIPPGSLSHLKSHPEAAHSGLRFPGGDNDTNTDVGESCAATLADVTFPSSHHGQRSDERSTSNSETADSPAVAPPSPFFKHLKSARRADTLRKSRNMAPSRAPADEDDGGEEVWAWEANATDELDVHGTDRITSFRSDYSCPAYAI